MVRLSGRNIRHDSERVCVCGDREDTVLKKEQGEGGWLTISETQSEIVQLRLCVSVLLRGPCRTRRPVMMTRGRSARHQSSSGIFLYPGGI